MIENSKYRLFTEEFSLTLNNNYTKDSFMGYFQLVKDNEWRDLDFIHERDHKLICKSFGFQHYYFTGRFKKEKFNLENVEMVFEYSILKCKKNYKTLSECFLSKFDVIG